MAGVKTKRARPERQECPHENCDHLQVFCNGALQSEWLRCLDCESVLRVTRSGRASGKHQPRATGCAT